MIGYGREELANSMGFPARSRDSLPLPHRSACIIDGRGGGGAGGGCDLSAILCCKSW